jgi:hypothetical protein
MNTFFGCTAHRGVQQFGRFILTLVAAVSLSTGIGLCDIVNSVSCSSPGAALSTGSSTCSASEYGYASATVGASVTLPTTAAQAAQIDTSASGSAVLGTVRGISSYSTAQASSDININFDTTGPVRSGFVELTFLQGAWAQPSFGSLSELLTIGSYSFSPDGQNLSIFLPMELGTEFAFSFLDDLTINGDAGSGMDSGSVASNISLQAFEADQTTPVELFDPPSSATSAVPEPESLGMMAVGTAVALFLIHKTRS